MNPDQKKIHISLDTIIIYPGQGVDNIVLFKSSQSEVKRFRGLDFTISKSTVSGKGLFSRLLYSRRKIYHHEGSTGSIEFHFATRLARKPLFFYQKKLQRIVISLTAKTSEGIIIGQSSFQDIIDKYGLPTFQRGGNHDLEYYYYNEGISFLFNSAKILTQIEIYKASPK